MKKYLVYCIALLAVAIFLFAKRYTNKKRINEELTINPIDQTKDKKPIELNRTPAVINYSQHALCRMGCRFIDSTEVNDILQNGAINFKKSNLQANACEKRFALDGFSKQDNQHIRIVVVPCGNTITVVTCIDLNKDWLCECGEEKRN
jgi:hypothetical protein